MVSAVDTENNLHICVCTQHNFFWLISFQGGEEGGYIYNTTQIQTGPQIWLISFLVSSK